MTLNYWRICIANALLFLSAYMLFPLIPFAMGNRLDMPVAEAAYIFPAFAAGMFAVGPFHAYLGDEYKRKHVLLWAMLAWVAATLATAFADEYLHFLLLALVQGGAFGTAATAGITVAIDITTSARRSAGNLVYAWASRLGMLIGAGTGVWLFEVYGFRTLLYLAAAVGLCAMLFAMRVYVAFRAPIGMTLLNIDRFVLPRAWLPAFNVVLIAFVPGVLLPLLLMGDLWPVLALGLLAILTLPFTRMFVKLSHHCQRGTANTTCQLATDLGVMAGMTVACRLTAVSQMHYAASSAAICALLLFVLITYSYYKRKRVR